MDLITIATKVAELILTKAIEQGGRRIGDLASDKVGNLISTIRNKFQKEEIEGKINKFEKDPNDKNKLFLDGAVPAVASNYTINFNKKLSFSSRETNPFQQDKSRT